MIVKILNIFFVAAKRQAGTHCRIISSDFILSAGRNDDVKTFWSGLI